MPGTQTLSSNYKATSHTSQPKYVPGQGNKYAKIMFIGEAPGAVEDQTGIPFNGPSGDLLWEVCREIGLQRGDVYTTNVIKYRPPNNDIRRLKEIEIDGEPLDIEKCVDQLWDEISEVNPNIIVCLGNTPLKYVTGKSGILKWRGSVIKSNHLDYKCIGTIHPAALLHSETDDYEKKGPLKYSWRHIIKLDLLRAIHEAETNLYEPPERVIEVARDSVILQRFLDRYSDRTKYDKVAVDIEVERSIPFCIAIAFNNWHAISIPLLNMWRVKKGEEGPSEHMLAEMWMMVKELLGSNIKVIGQNFKFDAGQLDRLCDIQIKNFYCDTSLLAHSLHPEFPKALDFTTSIYTNVPYYKEEGKLFNWKKDKVERILHYNGMDACVTFEVFEQMYSDAGDLVVPGFPNWREEFAIGYQRAMHEFYRDMEDVGLAVNLQKQKELLDLYAGLITDAEAELNQLCGWAPNVSSPKDMVILVYQQLKFPWRKGTGEEVITALLANTKKYTKEAGRCLELILRIRRLKLSRKKYFGARPDFDGRMRTVYNIAGTETGRSSTKMQKPPVRPYSMGLPFQTITKHGDIGAEIREMFNADSDEYVLIETDMSQAEARIVALLGNDEKLLKLFADKADIHRITASWIFGIPVAQITKELRFIGKTTRHAGNYDMGKNRLMNIVNTDAKKFHIDISISEWRAGKILDTFHAFSPNIRKVFHAGIQDSLQHNNRVLVNPFGRYRQFFDRWGNDLFKEAYAQIPQSTVPDHLRRAGLRAKQRFVSTGIDARFCIEAHDALVGIVRKEHADAYVKIMHEEIEVPIDFSRCTIKRGLLVIPAESKVGFNYKDWSEKNEYGLKDWKPAALAA